MASKDKTTCRHEDYQQSAGHHNRPVGSIHIILGGERGVGQRGGHQVLPLPVAVSPVIAAFEYSLRFHGHNAEALFTDFVCSNRPGREFQLNCRPNYILLQLSNSEHRHAPKEGDRLNERVKESEDTNKSVKFAAQSPAS